MPASFRTELHLTPQPQPLGLNSRVMTMGSCFADVIGQRMQQYKVITLNNPFGTIYNPLSLCKLLEASLKPKQDFHGELLERDGWWYAYDLHSSLTAPSREALLSLIQSQVQHTHDFLARADLLILTFGTAVGYHHLPSGQLVANCHKVPQREFRKTLLSLIDMQGAFADLLPRLQALRPGLRLLLTVSPVRHLKETLEGNSLSKALLRVLCQELTQAHQGLTYFPAYELLTDDLRDYRFYKADLIHPSEVAEDYIWEKFRDAWFDKAFQSFTLEWDKVRQALAHKPFQPQSPAHRRFLESTLEKLQKLALQADCSPEIAQVKKLLEVSAA